MLAVWKDLCLDALHQEETAQFWASATGLEVDATEHGVSLGGPTPRHRIWVNQVDRAKTVKNRLHLDIDCGSIDELVALGATVLSPSEDTGFAWTVMADPEGHEFCAFVRESPPSYRLHGIGVDCLDSERQARWWGELFGAEPTRESGDGWWTLTGIAVDERMTLDFAPVPEPRQGPNRVHWDVVGGVGVVDDVLGAGATHLWDTEQWTVLADPEGNEFCVFAARQD